ncbi:NAD(P)/FAD-dependent oxidoreductase [Rathayibacter toxicus]|uniref:NAD(P)/FAD-dependent oxidoreductase n=1 Tax=Rathayibacter toxicus TaxID=145458 RepID=UPI000696AAF3|nr:NAD(P)/FAD-dependent oxidoreductase [Rathayibacter toxicus]ALS57368.1 hypothetical protein APU90_05955 [Rathayibacter toxicus]QOD08393.1 tryptophan 7-halogenase [Rathayibacter toxicus]
MTEELYDEWDVIVIGGGPAGSAVATTLARDGRRVLIVEGARFPREHIGESLLAVSVPILTSLGVLPNVEREGFLRKRGAVFIWGPERREMTLGMPYPGYAFQVSRPRFDEILLNHARSSGSYDLPEHWAKSLYWEDGRVAGVYVLAAGSAEQPRLLRSRLVVDASGLFQFVQKKLNLPLSHFGPRRVAVTAYFSSAGRYSAPYNNDVISEATDDGWIWFIPLNDSLTSVGFVGDEADVVEKAAELVSRQIAGAPVISGLLSDAQLSRQPRLLKYTNHEVASSLWCDGYVLIGDSAIFVDPLFSTGVHGALYSGQLAGAAINSWLAGDLPEEVASEWYERRFRDHYSRIRSAIELLYALHPGEGRFWQQRSSSKVISDEKAEQIVANVGAGALAFFGLNHENQNLPLPPAIAAQLHRRSAHRQDQTTKEQDIFRLRKSVTISADYRQESSRLAPALVLRDSEGTAAEIELPSTGPAQRIISSLDANRTVLATWPDPAERADAMKLLDWLLVNGYIEKLAELGRTEAMA